MKKLMLMATVLVVGGSVAFAQDLMYGSDYGNCRNGNHMNGYRMGGNHRGGGHRNRGNSYYRNNSYNSQMPVAVQQQIQTIEQKYEVQRLAINQKYNTRDIALMAKYDDLYITMGNIDMRSMNNTLTPKQAQFILQMDELDAQSNQVQEERRNEVRALENQVSDAIDAVTKRWLSSIR